MNAERIFANYTKHNNNDNNKKKIRERKPIQLNVLININS